ncbi:hypothetical protein [Dictyobacter arantiisoli]|uniref:Uncharacterized protein n=1 Tax=Dictyobacter arantiisoli TaxID=2014874 RepID=A0A5A5TAZ6_9CHLR|nr:hypothetical protein [Dictyobacter arantiisoli]GCF08183.1 hypothetical protein KDI_17470 [Dictyobacter arantiisoli]
MSIGLVVAMNPVLAVMGPIAGIVVCLFAFLFVVLSVAINLLMSFGASWLSEKAEMLKMVRPYVDSVNSSTRAAEQGIAPSDSEQPVARMAAQIPLRLNAADKKVTEVSDTAVDKAIEFRARSMQVKQIAKAFFLPGLTRSRAEKEPTIAGVTRDGAEFASPGYRQIMDERPEVLPGQEPRPVLPPQQIVPTRR